MSDCCERQLYTDCTPVPTIMVQVLAFILEEPFQTYRYKIDLEAMTPCYSYVVAWCTESLAKPQKDE